MDEKKIMPKRRFKNYENCWNQKVLKDIKDVRDGTHESPKYYEDGYPFITSKNVSDGYINYNDIQYISNQDFEQFNMRSKVSINDILMGMIGTVGNIALIREEPDFAIKNVALIKDGNQTNQIYLYYFFQSNYLQKQLLDGLDGGTQKFISLFKIRNLLISIPAIKEQQKIGEFFKVLEERIANQERKIAKVKSLKDAYLTEMFPQKGETVPKRRFKEFEDEWEKASLGEVVGITMGHSPKSSNYTNDSSDNILVQGNADLKKNRVVPRVWTTQVTKVAYKGDLILTVRAPVGEVGKTAYDVVLGRGVAGLKGNEFIFQYLMKMKSEDYWNKMSTGSTFDSVNSDEIKKLILLLPSETEQQKIGAFFKNLDNQIEMEEKKLDKLQKMKEAYLEEMFV